MMLDSYLTTCDTRLLINNERWHLFASEKSVKAKIRNRLNIYKESLQPSTALRRVGCFWVAPHSAGQDKESWDEIIEIQSQGFWIGIKLLQIYRDELWTLITQNHKAWVVFAGNPHFFC